MADARATRLIQRFGDLESERANYENVWQKIADYELGRRQFTSRGNITEGRRRDVDLYDTTSQSMASMLAAGLHSLLTNPATEWFNLRPQDEELMQSHAVALWIDTVERIMLGAFQLPKSRFDTQIHETYIDLVAFGTGGLYVSDIPGVPRVLFSARPLSELYIAEDAAGNVDTVMRKFPYTHRQAVQRWGAAAPKKAHAGVAKGRSDEKEFYLQVVQPAEEPGMPQFAEEGKPIASLFLSLDESALLEEGGFFEMPFMIPRWEKDAGETWGRGPGWNALADAKMVGAMKKSTTQAGELAARPPVMMDDDGVVTQTAIAPGARISVRMSGGLNPPIQALDFKPNAVIPMALIQDTRQQIQEAYQHELLQLIRDPRMTATQVLEISANIQRVLAPILGRIQTELLEPCIERTYGLLDRKGAFPPPPPELAGQELKIEYVSPVARAQRASDTQAIVDTLTLAANWSQVDPSIVDVVDGEEAFRYVAQQRGVPPRVLRSRRAVAEMRQADAALAAQKERQEQLAQFADATAKLAPVIQDQGTA